MWLASLLGIGGEGGLHLSLLTRDPLLLAKAVVVSMPEIIGRS